MKIIDRLIQILSDERSEPMPILSEENKPRYFRALCNVRPPIPVSAEFLRLQDEYLSELTKERGVVEVSEIDFNDGIALWQGDITRLAADGIVNACNSKLLGCFHPLHGCIDNAIHSFAGVQVRLDCFDLMQGGDEPEGQVKVTKAYNLPSKFIFHTVGPQVYGEVTKENREKLESCYISCIEKAAEMSLKTLAFCCISTGVYGYPKEQAAELAVRTVKNHKGNLNVIFCVFDKENYDIYERLLGRTE